MRSPPCPSRPLLKRRRWVCLIRGTDGQATVELAMVLLLLMTLVFGVLEVGRGLNAWVVVTQAAREGARTAAARCTVDPACAVDVETRVTAALAGLAAPETARWSLAPGPYQAGAGVAVSVEYDIAPVVPLIEAMIPGGVLTVRGVTTMRLE